MSHRTRFDRLRILDTLTAVTRALGPHVERYAWVGSYRRGSELCGDADVLVTPRSDRLLDVVRSFGSDFYGALDFMYLKIDDVPVNVFACDPVHWGSSLQYTTGSLEHNLAVRSYAKRRGLMANQYGVFRNRTGGGRIVDSSETEEGFYRALGLRWPRPEMRVRRIGGTTGVFPLKPSKASPSGSSGNRHTEPPGNRETEGIAVTAPAGVSQSVYQRRTGR